MKLTRVLPVYLPDSRDVEIQRYGRGNTKIGTSVFTYSRLAKDTCPGASSECLSCCYALRIGGPVKDVYAENSRIDDVPPIPEECRLLRVHVSGDFSSAAYIENWIARLTERPDVTAWAYTRSWRVPELLPALERLRALPNVQLFASMDKSIAEMPPAGWRRAWIEGDARLTPLPAVIANREMKLSYTHSTVVDDVSSYVCPEETGAKPNCEACRYCIEGLKNDVTFIRH